MKKILFPLAFSPSAKQYFLYALDWAKKFNATLVVMHALGVSDTGPKGEKGWNEVGSEMMDKMMDFVIENSTKNFQDVKIQYIVQIGFPTNAIEAVTAGEDIDMIIMGMRAHATAVEAYFSSVAMNIISSVEVPVLLIPDTNKFDEIKNMTYTFNLEVKELPVILKIAEWAKKTKAILNLIHILENKENQDIKEVEFLALQSIFKGNRRLNELIDFKLSVGNFKEKIEDLSKELEMDLIVMLSHKRNFKTRYLMPSTASKVARTMDIPVLILKESYFFKQNIPKPETSSL